MGASRDGFTWRPSTGVTPGLETDAVIVPQEQTKTSPDKVYDVAVIGAGYAGLAAARDLADFGHNVLLIEARDRIGGRTYTAKSDGFLYEMGGTWVTHHMGYLHREMVRYNMDRDLITTGSEDKVMKGYYTINVPGATPRQLSHEEAGSMQAKAWDMFVDVDGQGGRTLCPLPHAMLNNPVVSRAVVERWDSLSCHDRLEQIKHRLTAEEYGLLASLLVHISGGNLRNSGLWDMVRSHALLMHNSDNFTDVWLRYKLRDGQTELARRMFDDARNNGLEWCFSAPVLSVVQPEKDAGNTRVIVSGAGTSKAEPRSFMARKIISTIPLNVLKTVSFSPPLSPRRREAIESEHVNQMTKIHADVADDDGALARWNGCRMPGDLLYGYGDGTLPNGGGTHVVAFGADQRRSGFVPQKEPERAVAALNALHPMDVKKLVVHDWSTDPYSRGGPAWWRPGYMSAYQDELQTRHGNVLFASADWAHGWRAAIDGALEQGTLNARTASQELKAPAGWTGRSRL